MIKVDIALPRKNFTLEIKETFQNGITGIYGPSGSGKTSLMHVVAGLARPQKGTVVFGSETIFSAEAKFSMPVEKRKIGYVFQEGRLFPHMTVEKNLLYGLKKRLRNSLSFNEVVDMLELRYILKSKPSSVSGGERQRTALGRTLLSSPEILLLDEPFSAVDTKLRNQIIPFLLKVSKKVNIPILAVSHELPDLLKLSSNICVIKNGKCLGHDHYFELLKKPEAADVLGGGTILNAVSLEVERVDADSGITVLWTGHNGNRIWVICEKSREQYRVGQKLNVFINAEDIALSSERIEGMTIQNQLHGTVIDLVSQGPGVLCRVDVGFEMTVEITAESQKRLSIIEGAKVWCLFKSVAIDVAV